MNENAIINCGLANLGATCFINSILQILLNIPELNDILNDKTYRQKLNNDMNGLLLLEWDLLREEMLKGIHQSISPNRFLSVLHNTSRSKNNSTFAGFDQNDVQEFLLFLIDCFHMALKKKVNISIKGTPQTNEDDLAIKCYDMIKNMCENDYSEIFNIFYGIHVSQLFNGENEEHISSKPEIFYSIDLQLPQQKDTDQSNLRQCFDLYTSHEIMDGDNMYFDESSGNKIIAKKNILFWSLPKILIIGVKRFNSTNNKLNHFLNFPIENLDLSSYVIGYNKQKYVYDLIGVCNHSGGVSHGHYTSFVKNQRDNNWYFFNDCQVILVENANQIITPNAYCFFYRMKE